MILNKQHIKGGHTRTGYPQGSARNSPNLEEFLNVCGDILEVAVGTAYQKNPNKIQSGFRLRVWIFTRCRYVYGVTTGGLEDLSIQRNNLVTVGSVSCAMSREFVAEFIQIYEKEPCLGKLVQDITIIGIKRMPWSGNA